MPIAVSRRRTHLHLACIPTKALLTDAFIRAIVLYARASKATCNCLVRAFMKYWLLLSGVSVNATRVNLTRNSADTLRTLASKPVALPNITTVVIS